MVEQGFKDESLEELKKGRLKRMRIIFDKTSVRYIGKESNNLEISSRLGGQEGDILDYTASTLHERILQNKDIIMSAKPKDARAFGISRQELWNVKHSLHFGSYRRLKRKVVRRLVAFLDGASLRTTDLD